MIVPAFNEAETLPTVLSDLRRALPGVDVVVVDDGSTDGTARGAAPPVAVLRLPFNLGIGGAMQAGYRYAERRGYRAAVQVDGDGQHPADEVAKLLTELDRGDADLVIGSRFLRGGSGYRQTAPRGVGAAILRVMIRMVSGARVSDCTSGFRAANRSAIEAFSRWYPDDYPEPEVIALLVRNDLRVAEVPVRMEQRATGMSSIRLIDGLVYVLKVSVALLLDLFRNPWEDVLRTSRRPRTRTPGEPGIGRLEGGPTVGGATHAGAGR